MVEKQLHVCSFLDESCEENHHNECSRIYEGARIRAVCNCNCHKQKESSGNGLRTYQTTLEDFGCESNE